MVEFVWNQVFHGIRRSWVLYLANIASLVLVVVLFAYLDGAQRQLDLQSTVFSGEVVFNVKPFTNEEALKGLKGSLQGKIPEVELLVKKIHTTAEYRLPGSVVGTCEMIGVQFQDEPRLQAYLTLQAGTYPRDSQEILLPSSMLLKSDLHLGDRVLIGGKTSGELNNSGRFKIVGIYDAPSMTLFQTPKFLVTFEAMERFYQPRVQDIQIGVFYRAGVPANAYQQITEALPDVGVEHLSSNRVSPFDFQNISIQFNIFLLILVLVTVFVVITIVFLVNFNVFFLLLRKRRQEFGTLLAFGVPPRTIVVVIILETLVTVALSVIFATLLCLLFSWVGTSQKMSGVGELLVVLLSGTNRIDLYVQPYQIALASGLVLGAALAAQIPNLIEMAWATPQKFWSHR